MASKGKAVATGKGSGGGKRKRGGNGGNDDKTGGGRKRNREVLQFFEDAADVDYFDSDDSDFDFSDDGMLRRLLIICKPFFGSVLVVHVDF